MTKGVSGRIIGTMASFPARSDILPAVIAKVAPQLDQMTIVLNEYKEVPDYLQNYANVEAIIPEQDFKDVGKFYPKYQDEDIVFLLDDDLNYSAGYVRKTIAGAQKIGWEGNVFGYHAKLLNGTGLKGKKYHFALPKFAASTVDLIGTGTLCALGRNIAPLDYMLGSERFVDVRHAKWCFENGFSQICLCRGFGRIRAAGGSISSIYEEFTSHYPPELEHEVDALLAAKREYDQARK